MGVLFNARHERFAQHLARGIDASEAYMQAGFNTRNPESARAAASRLKSALEIQDRVKEIMSGGAKRAEISRAMIYEKLLEAHEYAKGCKNPGSMIRALELLGKDIGMFVDRKEVKTTIFDELSDEALSDIEQELGRKIIAARTGETISGDPEETAREQDTDILSGYRTAS